MGVHRRRCIRGGNPSPPPSSRGLEMDRELERLCGKIELRYQAEKALRELVERMEGRE